MILMDAWNVAHAPRIVRPAPSASPPESAALLISSKPGLKARRPPAAAAPNAAKTCFKTYSCPMAELLQGISNLFLYLLLSAFFSLSSVTCFLISVFCSLSSVLCHLPSACLGEAVRRKTGPRQSVIRQPVPGRFSLGGPCIPCGLNFSRRRWRYTTQTRNSFFQGRMGRK